MGVPLPNGSAPLAPRVLLSLRDALISDAFSLLLAEAGFYVTACSDASEALIEAAARTGPDVIVVGSDLLAGAAPCTLTQLRARAPDLRIVVLLREGDEPCVRALLQHGVNGVIPMAARTTEAIAILRQVLDGNVVYPSLLFERLARAPEPELLSARQREVLRHLALGRSNDEIARRLFISRNTVKFHLREIYSRLGVRNRVEATREAQRYR
jgi:DNA-binding NarL/FixJ family response regulator